MQACTYMVESAWVSVVEDLWENTSESSSNPSLDNDQHCSLDLEEESQYCMLYRVA